MLNSNFDAIVPMVCTAAGALVVMLAEAWRDKDERMPLGVLGVIALVSSAIALAFLWNRNTSSFHVILADNFGIFVSLVLAVVVILAITISSQDHNLDCLQVSQYLLIVRFDLIGMVIRTSDHRRVGICVAF